MTLKIGLLGVIVLCTAACVSMPIAPLAITGTSLTLVSVNGKTVRSSGFSVQINADGSYTALYDCAEHFGTYVVGPPFVFSPGPETGKTCDSVDLKTGKSVLTDVRDARAFFAGTAFAMSSKQSRIIFSNGRSRYEFEQRGQTIR